MKVHTVNYEKFCTFIKDALAITQEELNDIIVTLYENTAHFYVATDKDTPSDIVQFVYEEDTEIVFCQYKDSVITYILDSDTIKQFTDKPITKGKATKEARMMVIPIVSYYIGLM